jgi:hypothetical protein
MVTRRARIHGETEEYKFIFLLYIIAIYLIVAANRHDPQDSQVLHVYPVPETKYLTLGHTNTVADSFWLKFIQNDDYCENSHIEKASNEGTSLDTILSFKMKESRCNRGWTFQILDFLTDLAPQFREAYLIGGTALIIGVDDREGSRIIFEKGLKHFPNDWVMNYRASYVYLFELQQPARAAELLMAAYKNGGPQFLAVLAARLYTKEGKAIIGKAILETFIKEHPDSEVVAHARTRLKEIEADLPNQQPPQQTQPSQTDTPPQGP